MKFTRDSLEALYEALEDTLSKIEPILEVLPPECEVTADLDFFTSDVVTMLYTGERYPLVPIQGEVLALAIASDELCSELEALKFQPVGHC